RPILSPTKVSEHRKQDLASPKLKQVKPAPILSAVFIAIADNDENADSDENHQNMNHFTSLHIKGICRVFPRHPAYAFFLYSALGDYYKF
ncbi:MAG: hypothetical protein K2K23_03400, partial [Muribaculaceae bacterium]|nr:hypothetical protein [Muribaculaceae bacterium]